MTATKTKPAPGPYDPSRIMILGPVCNNFDMFVPAIMEAAKTGAELPEEISDIFVYKVIVVNGQTRIIVTFA